MEVDIAISGGSVEGICAATGFLKAIETDLKHTIKAAAGNSAGGLILCLRASGRDIAWIEKFVLETDFSRFISLPKVWQVWRLVSLFKKGWLSDGLELERALQEATSLRTMREARFDLYVVGSDFTTEDLATFSPLMTPDIPLWLAARITSCLPVGFKPVGYEGRLYYDGGVRRHYPIDSLPYSPRPLIGYLVGHKHKSVPKGDPKTDLEPGLFGTLGAYIDNATDANVHDALKVSRQVKGRSDITIAYDDAKIGTFDFGMSGADKLRIIETARTMTVQAVRLSEIV